MFVVLQDRSGTSYGVQRSPISPSCVSAMLLLGSGVGFGMATGNILASGLLGIYTTDGKALELAALYAALSLGCSALGVSAGILGARYWGIGLRATYGS